MVVGSNPAASTTEMEGGMAERDEQLSNRIDAFLDRWKRQHAWSDRVLRNVDSITLSPAVPYYTASKLGLLASKGYNVYAYQKPDGSWHAQVIDRSFDLVAEIEELDTELDQMDVTLMPSLMVEEKPL